jgi:chromosomal replication initiator protein
MASRGDAGIDSPPFRRRDETKTLSWGDSLVQGSLWHRCLRQLETEVPEQQFNTWVRPLQAIEDASTLRLLAPNRFVVDWVQQHLLARLRELLVGHADGEPPTVLLEIGSRAEVTPPPAAVPAQASAPAARPRRPDGLVVGGRVNPDFTFATFVEGKSNQLARAAAMQVSENPGKAYNPLFIYGGVGLGKTHLMHAVANVIKTRNPAARIA